MSSYLHNPDPYYEARSEHAWLLRCEGLTYTEIGERLGANKQWAETLVMRFGYRMSRAMRRISMGAKYSPLEPLTVTLKEAMRLSGLGRLQIINLMKTGRLKFMRINTVGNRNVEHWGRILIEYDSLRKLLTCQISSPAIENPRQDLDEIMRDFYDEQNTKEPH